MANEEIRIENKKMVIEQGIKCLFRDGVYKFQLNTVAKECKLSEVSLRRYFVNKEKFMWELAMHITQKTVDHIEDVYCRNDVIGETGLEQFIKLMDALKNMYSVYECEIATLVEVEVFLTSIENRRDFVEKYREMSRIQTSKLREVIENGMKDGSIKGRNFCGEMDLMILWKNIWGTMTQFAILQKMGVHDSEFCRRALGIYADGLINSLKYGYSET